MPRLIDADVPVGKMDDYVTAHNALRDVERVDGVLIAKSFIDEQPTVDAVPVNEYRQVKFFNAEGIFEAFFPIKLNLDTVNRIEIGDKKFVSVVLCKDCKWFDRSWSSGTVEPIGYRCKLKNRFLDADDFCKRGERREEK